MVVTNEFEDPASRIERVIARQDRRFQRAFRQAIATIRDAATLEELAEMLARGAFEEAVAGVSAAAEALGSQYGASLSAAADDAAQFLSGALSVTIAFDQTNDRAVAMMRQNRLRLIREFSQQQRTVLNMAMQDGIARGLNPIDQARNFRGAVGLTERQEMAVQRYRALLTGRVNGSPSRAAMRRALHDGRSDRLIERMIRDGEALTPRQIESMVARYRQRYIKYRAEVIGRTEALRSAHQGTEEMYAQAIDMGQFRADQVVRTWHSAGDDRVRDSHVSLDGQERGPGEVWEGQRGVLRYPGDPDAPPEETIQCRCVLSQRILPPSSDRNVF